MRVNGNGCHDLLNNLNISSFFFFIKKTIYCLSVCGNNFFSRHIDI